jgi:MoaA/NifB/PqqE/SkfB family radical SAM enzyme
MSGVKGFYKKGYDYNSRAPYFVDKEQLTTKQLELLTESKTFCMMPWTHMHAFPDGRAYPCCLADYWHPVGDLRKNTMAEVWNQQPYQTILFSSKDRHLCIQIVGESSRSTRKFLAEWRGKKGATLRMVVVDIQK